MPYMSSATYCAITNGNGSDLATAAVRFRTQHKAKMLESTVLSCRRNAQIPVGAFRLQIRVGHGLDPSTDWIGWDDSLLYSRLNVQYVYCSFSDHCIAVFFRNYDLRTFNYPGFITLKSQQ